MQIVSDIMTRNVRCVSPQENLQRAAQLMGELDVGALPVCDGDRLVGMITDRDITIRATAFGRMPNEVHVDEVMSTNIRWVFEDQTLDEVMIQMADSQIRRVPVVSHDEQQKLVGIVALGDIATRTQDGAQKEDVEQLVELVSIPSSTSAQKQACGTEDTVQYGDGENAAEAKLTGKSQPASTPDQDTLLKNDGLRNMSAAPDSQATLEEPDGHARSELSTGIPDPKLTGSANVSQSK